LPNTNPRLSVVVPPNVDATLARLAALQKRSKSSVAREFLTEIEPVLARVAGLLELAAKAKQTGTKWPAEFVAQIESVQSDLERVALESMGQMDAFADTMKAAEAGAVGAAPRPKRARPKCRRTPHA